MRHRGFIAVCIAGALTAAWFAMSRSGLDRSPPERSLEHPATALEVTAATERAGAIATGREQDFEERAPSADDDPPNVDSNDPVTDQRTAMTAAASAASALARTFLSESRDRSWADTAEAELGSRIAQAPGLKLTTLRIECRETVCRMYFTFPAREEVQAGGPLVMAAVNGTPGYKTGGLILLGEDGTLTYYVRLRESGEPLP
jgi:hypothetical protein